MTLRRSWVWLAALALCASCKERSPLAAFHPPADRVLLPIPDRAWVPQAPEEGWCGETSIQMSALHFGAWVPQALANRLGKPVHPDLWEEDVPTSLTALGLHFERFGGAPADLAAFDGWLVEHVRRGEPVIAGVKLYPSDHPEWDVDHLLVVVGFTPQGFVVDTNMEGQQTLSYASLAKESPLSFVNRSGKLYGFAVSGFGDRFPVAAEVLEESDAGVALKVTAHGLEPGALYQLWRDDLDGGQKGLDFAADAGAASFEVQARADEAARFFVRESPALRVAAPPVPSTPPAASADAGGSR